MVQRALSAGVIMSFTKPEFPPLLPRGLHRFCLHDLGHICTQPFDLSKTRSDILFGLSVIVRVLSDAGVNGHLWVDGSFLTQKIDPADVDCVLRLWGPWVAQVTPNQIAALKWFSEPNRQADHSCHTFVFVEWPEGHSEHARGSELRDYWRRWFGRSRSGNDKGIASVRLPLWEGMEFLRMYQRRCAVDAWRARNISGSRWQQ